MATNYFTVLVGSTSGAITATSERTFTVTRGAVSAVSNTSALITVVATANVGPSGPTGATGSTGATGPTGPAGPVYQLFTVPSVLNVGTGQARFYIPQSLTITNIRASVGTAPTGSSVVLDVYKNGSTIFTTVGNRPTIGVGLFLDNSSIPDVTSLVAGDYLTIGIVQVGSIITGSDLTVQIELQPI